MSQNKTINPDDGNYKTHLADIRKTLNSESSVSIRWRDMPTSDKALLVRAAGVRPQHAVSHWDEMTAEQHVKIREAARRAYDWASILEAWQ